jgi:mannosylglycoprotein endo-beta-mannosidase
VCININGETGGYFRTHRGLRQGDPLSPLIFNLVANTLAHIMEKAKGEGLITGGGPTPDKEGRYYPSSVCL